jgi:fimbrial isopeptide formation D2 family protein/LPXTG-motif cell wall-anchored protein
MNKFLKKSLSFSLAALLTVGMSATAVYAEDSEIDPVPTTTADPATTEPTNTAEPTTTDTPEPTATDTPEPTPTAEPKSGTEKTTPTELTVSGLTDGDVVKFYKVLSHDTENGKTTGGWVATEAFKNLSEKEIQTMLGINLADGEKAGVSSELAGKIGKMINSGNAPIAFTATATGGVAKAKALTETDHGLYLAIVVSADPNYAYNPVFVAAADENEGAWALTEGVTYSDEAMTKKTKITVTKTANDDHTVDGASENYNNKSETVNAGDVIDFTIKTIIPEFSDNYEYATYQVKDTLSEGLELQDSGMEVKVGGENVAASHYDEVTSDHGFEITFKTGYLLGLSATADLEITYKAKVVSKALTSVNFDDNTVVVSFSKDPTYVHQTGKMANPNFDPSKPEDPENNPKYIDNPNYDPEKPETDDPSKLQPLSKLADKTNHYTFNLDGTLLIDPEHLGESIPAGETITPWLTTEIIKVALNSEGKEITENAKELHSTSKQKVGALEGAEFAIYTDEDCTTYYVNDLIKGQNDAIVSDENGRLKIKGEKEPGIRGLDAGTYWIKETKAPQGYIAHHAAVKVEILPEYEEKTLTIVDGTDTLTIEKKKVLKSYVVKVNNEVTATYTITNKPDGSAQYSSAGDTVTGANEAYIVDKDKFDATHYGKIANIAGAALPETGGIGTRMFYVIGGALAVGAGILLVAKKRIA